MKTALKILFPLFLFALVSCKSTKINSDSGSSFEIMQAYAKPWVAGIKDGGSGIEYTFVLKVGTIEKINFGFVWVNNQKLSSKIVRDNKILPNQELISSGDEIKVRCSGEKKVDTIIQPPKLIENDQALIGYYVNGESIKYVVVDKIEIKKSENRQ